MDEFPNVLANEGGLDVTQGPDGTLWVARNDGGTVFYQAPDEEATDLLKVKSVVIHILGGLQVYYWTAKSIGDWQHLLGGS